MSERVQLKTKASLGAFLDSVIDESLKQALHQKALQEKEKQSAQAGTQAPMDNSGGSGGGSMDALNGGGSEGGSGDQNASKTMDDETEKLKQGEVKVSDVTEKLNSIRSGKSFKDDKVKAAMEEYVDSLSKPEKVALLAFLKGIAQIVTGEVPGQQAVEPDSKPANVSMEKDAQVQHKTIKPNVIKGANTGDKKPAKGGAEDTSGPAPITPKTRG